MSLIQALTSFVKSKTSRPVVGPLGQGGWFRTLLPATTEDYEGLLAHRLHLNTIVALGVDYYANNYAQSPLIIERPGEVRGNSQTWEQVDGHPLQALFEKPNEYYDWSVLSYCIALSDLLDGNTYLLVTYNNSGKPAFLHWLPHDRVEPRDDSSDQDGTKLVTYYRYFQPGGSSLDFPPDRILHLRRGIDPNDMRRGMSPLKAALCEVWGDSIGARYTSGLLENFGVPPVVFSPKTDAVMNDDQRRSFIEQLRQKFGREGAGRPGFIPRALDVNILGYSPKDMELGALGDRLMNRICAAMGFDPMVLSLPSANKTYSNLEEATQSAYDRVILPRKSSHAAQITHFLLKGAFNEPELRVGWDYSTVPAMQDDIDQLWGRALQGWNSGAITEEEFRIIVNLPVTPESQGRYKAPPSQIATETPPKNLKSINVRDRAQALDQIRGLACRRDD